MVLLRYNNLIIGIFFVYSSKKYPTTLKILRIKKKVNYLFSGWK